MPRGQGKGKHGPSRPGGGPPRGERRGPPGGPRGPKGPSRPAGRPGPGERPAGRPFGKPPRAGVREDERRSKRGAAERAAGRPPGRASGRPPGEAWDRGPERAPRRRAGSADGAAPRTRPVPAERTGRSAAPRRDFAARDERPDRGPRSQPPRPRFAAGDAAEPRVAETAAASAAREGMAFGFHAVRTALTHSPRRVERLLLSRGAEDGRVRHLVALAREAGVPFQEVPKEALDRLSDSVRHQGVAARLAGADLHPAEELIDALPDDALVLVLDGIEDPRNIGAILRSAAAFGAAGVFLPIHHSAGLSPAAIKTAAGAIDLVPVARSGNVSRLLEQLTERGLTPVALDPDAGVPPWEAPLSGPIALVAGGEEKGIRPTVAERCPVRVRIPIRDEVGSLNVSVAVGIVLAETRRQREKPLPILDDGGGGC